VRQRHWLVHVGLRHGYRHGSSTPLEVAHHMPEFGAIYRAIFQDEYPDLAHMAKRPPALFERVAPDWDRE
jgi:hypothetical protein